MQPLFISKSAVSAETVGMAGEKENNVQHESEVAALGGYFYPLVMKSFGFWTPSSLASRSKDHRFQDYS